MTIYLPISISIALLILYVVISLSSETKYKIKRQVVKLNPLSYKYTIHKQNKLFKIWTGPLRVKESGEILNCPDYYTHSDNLEEVQSWFNDFSKYKTHKTKYFKVEYTIIQKDQTE